MVWMPASMLGRGGTTGAVGTEEGPDLGVPYSGFDPGVCECGVEIAVTGALEGVEGTG